MIYCLSCKKPTKYVNVKPKVTKNKRPYITVNCDICKRLKSKFVSINQIHGDGLLSNLFQSIPILNRIFLKIINIKIIQWFLYFNMMIF